MKLTQLQRNKIYPSFFHLNSHAASCFCREHLGDFIKHPVTKELQSPGQGFIGDLKVMSWLKITPRIVT